VDEVTERLLTPATSDRREHRPVPGPPEPAVAALAEGRGDL
jgi:hypothetical protein